MKDFLKFTFATVTGLVLTGVVFFLLSVFMLVGLAAAGQQKVVVQEESLFVLRLDAPINERNQDNPVASLMSKEKPLAVNDIVSSIDKARRHEQIKGIYLETGILLTASVASLEEIRNALLKFKESGKFVVAYSDHYSQGAYYLCSVADKLVLNPQGGILWKGLQAQPLFFKDMLDKLGVKMQIFKVGTYKSAVEPFTADHMSEANRLQTEGYLNSIWQTIRNEVAASRRLSPEGLDSLAEKGVCVSAAEELVQCGLADTLLYIDGVKDYLKQLMGNRKRLNSLELDEMLAVENPLPEDKGKDVIAVYYACGTITDIPSYSGENEIVGSKMAMELSRLRNDNKVKAVVIRIDSPGGSAFASEQIWREVTLLKAQKPVIVSMAGVAASGGYYIACAADSIFAEPTTLTGSIGIYGMMPDVQTLLNDKLGIHADMVKTNQFADMGDFTRPMTDAEKALMQQQINRGYELFVKRCAAGRNLPIDEILQVAEGRVWSGEMAMQCGLVDRMGGLDEALASAAHQCGISSYTLAEYPEPQSFFMELMNEGSDKYISAQIKNRVGDFYPYLQLVQRLQHTDKVQAHLGFDPNIRF